MRFWPSTINTQLVGEPVLITSIKITSLFSSQKFVAVVRESVDDAEEKVRIAEKEVGSKNIKKILNNVPVPKFLLVR